MGNRSSLGAIHNSSEFLNNRHDPYVALPMPETLTKDNLGKLK